MNKNALLSTLWIFLTLNFIFCDVFSLHYHKDLQNLLAGKVGDTEITQAFLLVFAMVMEIPILMIILSRTLKPAVNKVFNIVAASLLIVIQTTTLLWGENTLHYQFFSVIEITTCIVIVAIAWQRKFGAVKG